MTRKKADSERRTHQVVVRMNDREREDLRKLAEHADSTEAEVMRALLSAATEPERKVVHG